MPKQKLTEAELKAYQELARAARRVRTLAARRQQRKQKQQAGKGVSDA